MRPAATRSTWHLLPGREHERPLLPFARREERAFVRRESGDLFGDPLQEREVAPRPMAVHQPVRTCGQGARHGPAELFFQRPDRALRVLELLDLGRDAGRQLLIRRPNELSEPRVALVVSAEQPAQSPARDVEEARPAAHSLGAEQLQRLDLGGAPDVRPTAGVEIESPRSPPAGCLRHAPREGRASGREARRTPRDSLVALSRAGRRAPRRRSPLPVRRVAPGRSAPCPARCQKAGRPDGRPSCATRTVARPPRSAGAGPCAAACDRNGVPSPARLAPARSAGVPPGSGGPDPPRSGRPRPVLPRSRRGPPAAHPLPDTGSCRPGRRTRWPRSTPRAYHVRLKRPKERIALVGKGLGHGACGLSGFRRLPHVSDDELSHRSHDAAWRRPPITDRGSRHAGWKHGASVLFKNGPGQV